VKRASGFGPRASGKIPLVLLLAVACSSASPTTAPVTVTVDGADVRLDGDLPLRALRLDLGWDATLTVSQIDLGADDQALNIWRVQMNPDGVSARVLISDTRKVHLPQRGAVVHLTTSGAGRVRVLDVDAAADGPAPVTVEIR
jgi:hypothetical protein